MCVCIDIYVCVCMYSMPPYELLNKNNYCSKHPRGCDQSLSSIKTGQFVRKLPLALGSGGSCRGGFKSLTVFSH